MKRLPLKACQCGARPVWRTEATQPRGRRTARAERLACPLCGNATGPDAARERLAAEWNSAGWCGQGPAEPEYVPFGPEWRARMMGMRKPELVGLFETECRRTLHLYGLVARLRGELAGAEGLVAKLRARRTRREICAVIDRLVQRGVVAAADAAGAKRRLLEGDERSTLNVQRSTLNAKGEKQ